MANEYYIIKSSNGGNIRRDTPILISNSGFLNALADCKLPYITMESPTKLWKITVDDNGDLSTEDITPE